MCLISSWKQRSRRNRSLRLKEKCISLERCPHLSAPWHSGLGVPSPGLKSCGGELQLYHSEFELSTRDLEAGSWFLPPPEKCKGSETVAAQPLWWWYMGIPLNFQTLLRQKCFLWPRFGSRAENAGIGLFSFLSQSSTWKGRKTMGEKSRAYLGTKEGIISNQSKQMNSFLPRELQSEWGTTDLTSQDGLKQSFSPRGYFIPRGYSAVSGDSFSHHNLGWWESAWAVSDIDIYWQEARDASKYKMYKTMPYNRELFSRISIVPKLRKRRLEYSIRCFNKQSLNLSDL